MKNKNRKTTINKKRLKRKTLRKNVFKGGYTNSILASALSREIQDLNVYKEDDVIKIKIIIKKNHDEYTIILTQSKKAKTPNEFDYEIENPKKEDIIYEYETQRLRFFLSFYRFNVDNNGKLEIIFLGYNWKLFEPKFNEIFSKGIDYQYSENLITFLQNDFLEDKEKIIYNFNK